MKHIKHTAFGAIAAVLVLTGSVAASTSVTAKHHVAKPLVLASQPGTPEDRLARQLMAHELWQSRGAGDNPLVFVRKTRFAGNEFLFVQIQSTRECGSAGCSTASFEYTKGKWVKVLDTIGGTIQVENSEHSGMPDLFIRESGRLIWDGTRYG